MQYNDTPRGYATPGDHWAPFSFIGIAEQTDLIVSIGGWGLRAACEQVRSWDSIPGHAGEEPLTVMVNLSPRQLQQAGLRWPSPTLGGTLALRSETTALAQLLASPSISWATSKGVLA